MLKLSKLPVDKIKLFKDLISPYSMGNMYCV